ncbi:MAG: HAD-IIIA family hydrolase [Sutterellaceae bacterium]|nr:HAD-IIIA family hydrolase [Sutterellaceae bacterium]
MTISIEDRAKKIRLVVLDVDGVLTDGSIWTGENGEAVKRFSTRDGLGIKMLQAAGIPVAILTGRNSKQTAARAKELGIESVAQGKLFKTDAWHEILKAHNLAPEACAYMGDDVPDIPVLRATGLSTAPADAMPEIAAMVHWVSPKAGGNGAVRSLAELILKAQGKWDDLVESRYIRGEIL